MKQLELDISTPAEMSNKAKFDQAWHTYRNGQYMMLNTITSHFRLTGREHLAKELEDKFDNRKAY